MPARPAPKSTPFAFSHRRLAGRTSVIALEGDLDLVSAPTLKWALVDVVDAGENRLIVDLSLVAFLDSTALGVLVAVKRGLDADGIFALACANRAILKLLEVTGLDRTFDLFPTVEAALAYVQRKPLGVPDQSDIADAGDVTSDCDGREDAHEEHESTPGHRAGIGTVLTRDAAVVLGLASTAMPFARSSLAQAERWLRALRQHGDAGMALTSLGLGDESSERTTERTVALRNLPRHATDADVVTTVTRRARHIAARREASTIRTTDLLCAVMEVYGRDFERVLSQHGVNSNDVTEHLELHQSASGNPVGSRPAERPPETSG